MSSAIRKFIEASGGAISLGHYMRLALTSPRGGYYTTAPIPSSTTQPPGISNRSQIFGQRGDFITSPEISQMFGELVGVWLLNQVSSLRRDFSVIEIGPGRGTMIADILMTWLNFPHKTEHFARLHLVEPSAPLRQKQRETLEKTFGGGLRLDRDAGALGREKYNLMGLSVEWHEHFESIPNDETAPVVLAHELFDALPIHQFQLTAQGWREVMVALDGDSKDANNQTPKDSARFRFVLSANPPPERVAGLVLPDPKGSLYKPGDFLEISPESLHLCKMILSRIQEQRCGLALVIDYGYEDLKRSSSFRGIRRHKFSDPLENVGDTDLTADVDFAALTRLSRRQFPDVETFNLLTQQQFLKSCGIEVRLQKLLLEESIKISEEQRENLKSGCERLISTDENGMGQAYKFWAARMGLDSADPYPFTNTERV